MIFINATVKNLARGIPQALHGHFSINIFIHVIPEDGPYGPKYVVTIISA
jgi:hypothetical protein